MWVVASSELEGRKANELSYRLAVSGAVILFILKLKIGSVQVCSLFSLSSLFSGKWKKNSFLFLLSFSLQQSVLFSLSVVSDSLQSHGLQHARPPCLSSTPGVHPNSSIESVMPSNHLILCVPLLLLPSKFPGIRVFSSELVLLIIWPKYWSFSFSISFSNEYSGLISFRIDCLESTVLIYYCELLVICL